jgi:hypothetical protein
MPVTSVNYDLYKEPSRIYARLERALKAFNSWCRPTESSWFLYTPNYVSPQEIYEYLKPYLHRYDKIVITPVLLNGSWWTQGMTPQTLAWLHAALNVKPAAATA